MARRAASLLAGGYEGEEFLLVVGGSHAEGIVHGAPALYWPEVWGARALLYVWDAAAAPTVIAGLGNQSWRVREMCARVCAEHGVGTVKDLVRRTTDENARVRTAAARAIAVVGDETGIRSLEAMLRDPERDVRRAAQQSLAALRERLGDSDGDTDTDTDSAAP
ncbi:HEAT repeat domain-containing protein [Subtercola sp. Z020]|uniref:HEAT repeat domain-containing protein n=1 Tax=Subtercola sp. Z020 TaxID=2080582 RepID=UPI001E39162E|nr:HEAT repeat domain-containing protein [Subtercola sp. Z020]